MPTQRTQHQALFSFRLESDNIGPDLRYLLSEALLFKCWGELLITYMLTKFGANRLLQLQPDITTNRGKIRDSRYLGCRLSLLCEGPVYQNSDNFTNMNTLNNNF